MIINNRKDLDAAPQEVRDKFMNSLSNGINRWVWDGNDWVIQQDDSTITRYDFTLADFPDAPTPEMPDYNPDEKALQQARESATLTRMAFMLALEEAGLYDEAEAAVDSEAVSKAGKIMWRNASVFNRMDETLNQFATSLGYTEQQMDQLFGIEP